MKGRSGQASMRSRQFQGSGRSLQRGSGRTTAKPHRAHTKGSGVRATKQQLGHVARAGCVASGSISVQWRGWWSRRSYSEVGVEVRASGPGHHRYLTMGRTHQPKCSAGINSPRAMVSATVSLRRRAARSGGS